ncbi:MAG: molybdopterin-guanine dinucleotide biosynthesis protein B [Nitrososphaerales archaeon]
MRIIHFLGFSDSGKTTTIERLCRMLVVKRCRVGILKHTHAPNFTIDTPRKDTWKFARAGAKIIVSLADSEIAIIRKEKISNNSLERILNVFRRDKVDYLFIEGFHQKLRKKSHVARILCANNEDEAMKLLKKHGNPMCITGNITNKQHKSQILGVPVIKDIRRIAKIITDDRLLR